MFTDASGLGQHTVSCHFWLLQRKTKIGHSVKIRKGPLVSPDSEECKKKSSAKTCHSVYTHHSGLSLAAQKCRSKILKTAGSWKTESSKMKWPNCQMQHSSASVRDQSRECSFVQNLHHAQRPLPFRKCALDLPTQFIGQKNCGSTVCVEEQQFGSVSQPQAPGQTEANGHTFDKRQRTKTSCGSSPELKSAASTGQNSLDSLGYVAENSDGSRSMHNVIFSTEVPQETTCSKRCSQAGVREDSLNISNTRKQTYIFSSKGTQNVLRDQIHKVVVNLEEVLHSLKEVQLEMKEVVQQIDKLTSSIDLELEDSTLGMRCHSTAEIVSQRHKDTSVHTSRNQNSSPLTVPATPMGSGMPQESSRDQSKSTPPPPPPPPAYPIHNFKLKSNNGTAMPQTEGPKSEGSAQSKRQKPPPYPFNGKVWRADKDKTPSYLAKRTLLSTTV